MQQLRYLNLENTVFQSVVDEIFGKKGEEVVKKNLDAIARGREMMTELLGDRVGEWELAPADGKRRMFMIGNDAIALGALSAGVRFMAAYPITPASEIMEYLIKKLPKFGGAVIQTEDEIAAATMAIGANYGGVRSFTASAGPGLITDDGSNRSFRYDGATTCRCRYTTWWSINRSSNKTRAI